MDDHKCEAMEGEFEDGLLIKNSWRIVRRRRCTMAQWFLHDLDCTCAMKGQGVPIRYCPFCGVELPKAAVCPPPAVQDDQDTDPDDDPYDRPWED